MKRVRLMKWVGLLSGTGILLQLGGCVSNDLLIGLAGAGAIVSGVINILGVL